MTVIPNTQLPSSSVVEAVRKAHEHSNMESLENLNNIVGGLIEVAVIPLSKRLDEEASNREALESELDSKIDIVDNRISDMSTDVAVLTMSKNELTQRMMTAESQLFTQDASLTHLQALVSMLDGVVSVEINESLEGVTNPRVGVIYWIGKQSPFKIYKWVLDETQLPDDFDPEIDEPPAYTRQWIFSGSETSIDVDVDFSRIRQDAQLLNMRSATELTNNFNLNTLSSGTFFASQGQSLLNAPSEYVPESHVIVVHNAVFDASNGCQEARIQNRAYDIHIPTDPIPPTGTGLATQGKLKDFPIGTIIRLREDDAIASYILVHKGSPSDKYRGLEQGVTLLRQHALRTRHAANSVTSNAVPFNETSVFNFLNTEYVDGLSVQNYLKEVRIPTQTTGAAPRFALVGDEGILARAFLLSAVEAGGSPPGTHLDVVYNEGDKLDYFLYGDGQEANARRAIGTSYLLRGRSNFSNTAWARIASGGTFANANATTAADVRPLIVLPGDMDVTITDWTIQPRGARGGIAPLSDTSPEALIIMARSMVGGVWSSWQRLSRPSTGDALPNVEILDAPFTDNPTSLELIEGSAHRLVIPEVLAQNCFRCTHSEGFPSLGNDLDNYTTMAGTYTLGPFFGGQNLPPISTGQPNIDLARNLVLDVRILENNVVHQALRSFPSGSRPIEGRFFARHHWERIRSAIGSFSEWIPILEGSVLNRLEINQPPWREVITEVRQSGRHQFLQLTAFIEGFEAEFLPGMVVTTLPVHARPRLVTNGVMQLSGMWDHWSSAPLGNIGVAIRNTTGQVEVTGRLRIYTSSETRGMGVINTSWLL